MPKRARVLTEKDQMGVLSMIRQCSRYPIRDVAIFSLSQFAGMRVGEIAELDLEDVLDASGMIKEALTLTRTKRERVREVYLIPALRSALEAHIEAMSEGDKRVVRDGTKRHPLFLTKNRLPFNGVTACQLFARFYGEWSNLDGAKGHSGRRTFITNLAERGYNLKHISVLAGHASVQTTAIYVESNPKLLHQMALNCVSARVAKAVQQR